MAIKKAVAILLFLILSAAIADALTVSGNRIYDANGNPLLLRGVARPSLEWNAQGQYLALSDYQLMANWGANIVRLSLSECFWLGIGSNTNVTYPATVAQQVAWITSLNMYVILDLHWSNAGGTQSCNQQEMADSASITFWSQVASIYANNPSVLFELYNEPYGVSWDVWRNGGDSGNGWTVVGMQTLYNTVRATGANNVVIVGGLNYAFNLSGIPTYALNGTNIVYNTHPYDDDGKQLADYPSAFGFLAGSYALIATEFGDYDCSATYYTNFIDYANQNAISYTAWGWFVSGCGFPSLINDWSGTPSASGVVVQSDLTSTSKVPGVTTGSAAAIASGSTAATNGGTTATATTGGAGTGNLSIYIDSVVNFQDWSWATTRNAQDPAQHHSGLYSYSWSPNNYDALYFYEAGGITTTEYEGVEFYVHGGFAGGQQINFNLIQYDGSSSNKIGPSNSVASYTSSGSIVANTWVRGYVSFSAFPSGSYDGFWFEASESQQQLGLYFDDITLLGFPPSTTGTTDATTASTSTTAATTTSTVAATTTTTAATSSTTAATTASTAATTSHATSTTAATTSSTTAATTTTAHATTTTTAASTTSTTSTTAATTTTTHASTSATTSTTAATTSTLHASTSSTTAATTAATATAASSTATTHASNSTNIGSTVATASEPSTSTTARSNVTATTCGSDCGGDDEHATSSASLIIAPLLLLFLMTTLMPLLMPLL